MLKVGKLEGILKHYINQNYFRWKFNTSLKQYYNYIGRIKIIIVTFVFLVAIQMGFKLQTIETIPTENFNIFLLSYRMITKTP